MIKIEPLFATDSAQARALLRQQNEPMPYESFCAEEAMSMRGFAFLQHWLPCTMHFAPSVYVAKEEGVIIGLISLSHLTRSRRCWRVEHLVVHPNHRGRGIAQELLKFAFATFGSQGALHFLAEVSDLNSAALSLLGAHGFRRCYRVTHYQVPVDFEENPEWEKIQSFRLALPNDRLALHQLYQDSMPADLRLTYEYMPEDFLVSEVPAVDSFDKLSRRLLRRKVWFWVSQDPDRKILTSAVKVTAHRDGDYHLELAVHPGYSHTADELVLFTLNIMRRMNMRGVIATKSYDFQKTIAEALEKAGLERTGFFSLLVRDHWVRAQKKTRKDSTITLPSIANPSINMPLPAERRILD